MKCYSNDDLLNTKNSSYRSNRDMADYRRAVYEHRTAVVRKERMILIAVFCLALFITSFILTGRVYADNNTASDSVKMYKSITIYAGDTLETIAAEYMSDEYSSVVKYINEVSSINGLNVDSELTPGNNIIIPYYMSKSISNNPVIEISLAN